MTARFCRAFTTRYPIEEGQDLVHSDATGKSEKFGADTAQRLQSCALFRTLEQHSAAIERAKSPSKKSILEELKSYADAGFLISDEQFIEHCRASSTPESAPPPIATIGVTTRNRPELLRRALTSFHVNARKYGRRHDYNVIDDGLTADEQSNTFAAVTALAAELGATIRYANRQQRLTFANRLADVAGVSADVIEFALLGDASSAVTTGAARNSLLLDTVGDLYLLIDDDSVCRVAPCPDLVPGVALDVRGNPTELWFAPDRDTLLGNTKFVEQDPLAAHEVILGRPLAECLPGQGQAGDLDLSYATTELTQPIWQHGGRVMATSAGVVGDSGMGSTSYLALSPESQARLARSEQEYVSAVVNRQFLRAPLRTTIARGTFCAGASLGLDNRVLLPPFVPVQRNSDGLFARTLRRCFRDGYKGYLPWAVLHDPLPPRAQSPEGAEADAERIRLTHILRALIVPETFKPSGDPARDLRRLGDELIEIASKSPRDFRHIVKPRVVRDAAVSLQAVRQAASVAGTPEFLTRRQTAYWQRLSEALSADEYFVPRDLEGAKTHDEIQQAVQRVVLRFGQLLGNWPAIVEAAKLLRSRGVRLGKSG